jgi:hypothetical protein
VAEEVSCTLGGSLKCYGQMSGFLFPTHQQMLFNMQSHKVLQVRSSSLRPVSLTSTILATITLSAPLCNALLGSRNL